MMSEKCPKCHSEDCVKYGYQDSENCLERQGLSLRAQLAAAKDRENKADEHAHELALLIDRERQAHNKELAAAKGEIERLRAVVELVNELLSATGVEEESKEAGALASAVYVHWYAGGWLDLARAAAEAAAKQGEP